MKDTRIVFIGIGLLTLIPILFQGGKHIWLASKGHSVKYLWARILMVLVASAAVILLITALYNFTVGYQAPLVAEQFHGLFYQRINKTISQEEYLSVLKKENLAVTDFTFVKDEEIENSGLVPGEYSVSISENIYENDDGTVTLYALYQKGDAEIYTALILEINDNRWKAVEHQVLKEEDLDKAGLQKRFYEIEVGG